MEACDQYLIHVPHNEVRALGLNEKIPGNITIPFLSELQEAAPRITPCSCKLLRGCDPRVIMQLRRLRQGLSFAGFQGLRSLAPSFEMDRSVRYSMHVPGFHRSAIPVPILKGKPALDVPFTERVVRVGVPGRQAEGIPVVGETQELVRIARFALVHLDVDVVVSMEEPVEFRMSNDPAGVRGAQAVRFREPVVTPEIVGIEEGDVGASC